MKKERKKRVYFSINKELCEKFEDYISKNSLSQSAVLEKLVDYFLTNERKNAS